MEDRTDEVGLNLRYLTFTSTERRLSKQPIDNMHISYLYTHEILINSLFKSGYM